MTEYDDMLKFGSQPYRVRTDEPLMPVRIFVRPCREIMAETMENVAGISSIAERFKRLTQDLPLEGGEALREVDGELDIIRHLRLQAPWFGEAIDLLDRQFRLQLWAGLPWISFRPMLLVGPPGSGKSRLASIIGGYAGCGSSSLDFAGISDSRTIEGTARGWNQTQPCFPAVAMEQHKTANPIIIVEEVDKAGRSPMHGDPVAVLLTMIERATAQAYYDKCLMANVDLSHVNWLLTANTADNLPKPLLSRLDVVHVDGPGPEHFDALLTSICHGIRSHWQLTPAEMPSLHPKAETTLRRRFTHHRSARQLARETEAALSAVIPLLSRATN